MAALSLPARCLPIQAVAVSDAPADARRRPRGGPAGAPDDSAGWLVLVALRAVARTGAQVVGAAGLRPPHMECASYLRELPPVLQHALGLAATGREWTGAGNARNSLRSSAHRRNWARHVHAEASTNAMASTRRTGHQGSRTAPIAASANHTTTRINQPLQQGEPKNRALPPLLRTLARWARAGPRLAVMAGLRVACGCFGHPNPAGLLWPMVRAHAAARAAAPRSRPRGPPRRGFPAHGPQRP